MNIGGRSFRKINNKLKKSMKLFEEAGGNSLSADKVRQLGEIEQVKKLQTEKSSKEQTLKNIENNKVVRKTLRKMRKVLQKFLFI
ncbi:hypothetical protein MHBO_004196 [Bonamia ostreae]|uniref:Uncharacterized protein n=1 Tax=Bonamia ostreae TaxID=126728 RepID=A0ABV2ATE9_9EUKA